MPTNLPATHHRFEHGMYLRERGPTTAPSRQAACRAAESGTASSLLFVHGLGESGLCFEHLLDNPGSSPWIMLVPDLPGYGRSPWPDQPLTLVGQVDHLANWLRVTGRGPVVVVGHSMGGVTALMLCERHPDLVQAVVDVDGNLSLGDCVYSSQAAEQCLAEFQREGFADLQAAVFRAGQENPAQRGYYVSLRLCSARQFHCNSTELVELSNREDLAKRLSALPVPALYIAGVPGGVSTRSLLLLKHAGAKWLAIEPAGHWPFIDQPDGFMAGLERFLEPVL